MRIPVRAYVMVEPADHNLLGRKPARWRTACVVGRGGAWWGLAVQESKACVVVESGGALIMDQGDGCGVPCGVRG